LAVKGNAVESPDVVSSRKIPVIEIPARVLLIARAYFNIPLRYSSNQAFWKTSGNLVPHVLPHYHDPGPGQRLNAVGTFKPLNDGRIGPQVQAMIIPSGSSTAVLKAC
jgi:hypothetical protein